MNLSFKNPTTCSLDGPGDCGLAFGNTWSFIVDH